MNVSKPVRLIAVGGVTVICGTAAMLYGLHTPNKALVDRDNNDIDESSSSHRTKRNLWPRATLGRMVGVAASIPLPNVLRSPAYHAFCNTVGCDVTQTPSDLSEFRSVAEFMRRRVQPVSVSAESETLVAPCGGVVDAAGAAKAFGRIRVKGVDHVTRDIVGAPQDDPLTRAAVSVETTADKNNDVKRSTQAVSSHLWYIVIWLRACDAHRFSSPCDWKITERRHIRGGLLCPGPTAAEYPRNERVALVGAWNFGYFSFTAVGAAARRAVDLSFEPRRYARQRTGVASSAQYSAPLPVACGQELGAFRIGSAIVLIFEAPDAGFSLLVRPGDQIRLGQPLASFDSNAKSSPTSSRSMPSQRSTRERFRRSW